MSAPVLLVTSYLPLVTTSLTSASGVEVAAVVGVGVLSFAGVEHAARTNTREPPNSMLVNFISCYLFLDSSYKINCRIKFSNMLTTNFLTINKL